MGAGSEDDAVLVDDVDLALGVDFASDFGGPGGRVEDFVEGDPLSGVGAAGRLVEIDGGLAADIEGFPVEEGLSGGLGDVDIVAGGGGGVGALPLGVGAGEDFQAAIGESIGDGASSGGSAGGGLEGSHVVDGLCGAGEAVLGADLGGLGGFGSRVGAGFGVAGGVFGGGSATQDVAGVERGGGAEGHGG